MIRGCSLNVKLFLGPSGRAERTQTLLRQGHVSRSHICHSVLPPTTLFSKILFQGSLSHSPPSDVNLIWGSLSRYCSLSPALPHVIQPDFLQKTHYCAYSLRWYGPHSFPQYTYRLLETYRPSNGSRAGAQGCIMQASPGV